MEATIDKTKTFSEQAPEVQQALVAAFYGAALFEPNEAVKQEVAANGQLGQEVAIAEASRKTTFDVFARPRLLVVTFDGFTLLAERVYIDASTCWRMDREVFTLIEEEQ
ncbi:hypothetical protein [Williamwhitmania taraxaci]|uniref:Uncharacterized protein n=1 Tax=Williamwhitmania taraxaci TaxID=1640674 RepID=A0A1G6M9G2_9BACT|nr:hypothetical protein [Williamwhitmania taraxaci]SDC52139.1 hypothetical protein SAMN05216323_10358 [Williamwhitmania taraxaci]